MAHADVAVVGGGLWGLSIAWHLANGHGVTVKVVERRAAPGLETSGRAAGQLGQVREHPLAREAARFALEFASGLARRRDPSAFVRSGSVTLVESEAAATRLRPRFAAASAAGIDVDVVSGAEAAHLIPGLSGQFAGRYVVPGDGYVDPPRYVAALAADLAAVGSEVLCDAAVEALDLEGSRVIGVRTTKGLISAAAVVVAAGPWTALLSPTAATRLAVQPIPLRQARTQACGVSRLHPVVRFPEIGAYVRPEEGGYLFGAFEPLSEPLPSELRTNASTSDLGPDESRSTVTRDRLARWIPALGQTSVDHYRQGWTTFTPDGLPLAGPHARLRNLWLATGCGAMGFVWAASLGRWLAQSIVEDQPIPLIGPLDPGRFGLRTLDPAWVRDESVRRHDNYYGLTNASAALDPDGPSAEHYAWK